VTRDAAARQAPARASQLLPGLRLLHADLHNHTVLSDGDGDPARAFGSMRAAGLDVAAITDHVRPSPAADPGGGYPPPDPGPSLDPAGWRLTGALADGADHPGAFVALRGFEWSHSIAGHVNVWGSRSYVRPPHAPAEAAPSLWRWLGGGDGLDGLAGFNHPGREPGVFGHFAYQPQAAERLVGFEIFNRDEEYLFAGMEWGLDSPLVRCLEAGWRPGLTGVTDEHGADWGRPEGKGRTGLWASEPSRQGVRAALLARRVFATRERNLLLAAVAGGEAGRAPMGGTLAHRGGPVRFEVELDRGPGWWGRPLLVQVLRPGRPLPRVAAAVEFRVARPGRPALGFDVDLDPADGAWAVLRITDPAALADPRAPAGWRDAGRAVAYASPFWLAPPQTRRTR
jgi:hypothetical protein